MAKLVCAGATMTCSFGVAPCPLIVLPDARVLVEGRPAANIMDYIPITNIATFGMCNSTSNPAVIATTAAAQGVHTPAPCVPATSAPWTPPATKAMIGGQPALLESAKCTCTWGGSISFTMAGSIKSNGT